MAGPKKIKTSLYLPETLFWKLKEETVRRRFPTDTAAMEQAIQKWVETRDGDSVSTTEAPSLNKWHVMLADILASGDQEAISAVQQNLLVFHRVKVAVPASPDKPLQSITKKSRKG